MSCNNLFCTCYLRGYKAGYINGYGDAALQLPPPISFQQQILERLVLMAPGALADPWLPSLRPRASFFTPKCNCLRVCTCGNGGW
jgi:hypothetical protein